MADFEELPVSEIASSIADSMSARYLGEIAADGVWRASEEQLLNPKGYFGAQRRVGIDNEEFIDGITSEEQAK